MRILITGANGFIGRACTKAFHLKGWKVRTVSTSSPPEVKGVECFSQLVINTVSDWMPYLDGVDVVLHLAGVAHQPRVNPSEYQRVNARGSEMLALASLDAGVSRFIFLSSIAVYDHLTGEGLIAENSPTNPSNEYGQSKLDAELAIRRITRGQAMAHVILQPPLVYGPKAPGNFRRLVHLIRAGVPLPLLLATSVRSYIGIDNLISAIFSAATHPNAANQKFVVCDDEDISTVALINLIANNLGCKARLWKMPKPLLYFCATLLGRSEDVSRTFKSMRIDPSKIKNSLGWRPELTLGEGISRALRD